MIKHSIKWILLMILCYFLVFGVLIFDFNKDVSEEYKNTYNVERFYSNNVGPDRALVVDSPKDAALTRMNVIANTKETLDIAYYAIENDGSTEAFIGLILDAADRGVNVRILLDGMTTTIKYKNDASIYALCNHPNIEVKKYEPLKIFMPWRINNRLHEKYIISDNEVVILGGRNIGDRFWGPENYDGEITYDRDVLVYNSDKTSKDSVLPQVSQYFDDNFNGKYSKSYVKRLSKKQVNDGKNRNIELKENINFIKMKYEKYFNSNINWEEVTCETNKITLIHNPVNRFKKEPWILYEVKELIKNAKNKVFIQSPYIVLEDKSMQDMFNNKNNVMIDVLTNSEASTPNLPAYGGYLNYRDKIVKSGANIYEYHGEYSIHAKTYMIDDDISLIGSFNLDPRSAYLSTETMLVINSKELNNELRKVVNKYMDKSLLVGENGKYEVSQKSIDEREIGKLKKVALEFTSLYAKFFEFLL
ncbi:phospholipase D-like domain-containing protein [Clostridium ihumii]|uniref:phospholipase D-like domain-containing protein n=1 Tax=Clostridium ihumii TaxID=1470356 RepID=UPI003D32D14D